jgi:predicted hydrocarbon binding protein
MAEEAKGDVERVLTTLAGHLGPQNARREGRLVSITYPACYCPMVTDVTEPLSPTYCHCSAGWLKELFETVSGKPVEVEILETIKRGGAQCRFNVKLEA